MDNEQITGYLKKLRKCVMESDASFGIDIPYIQGKCQNMHFLQNMAENSKMIYASNSIDEPDFDRLLSCCGSGSSYARWKLAAFATGDGKIYIYDKYALQLPIDTEQVELPEGVFWFGHELEELKNFIGDSFLPEYLDGLPVEKERYADEAAQEEIRKGARKLLLGGEEPAWKIKTDDMVEEQEAFDHLCGYRDIRDAAGKHLDSIRDDLIDFKTKKFLIENLEPDLAAEPWERELAQAVKNAGAKQIAVTFMAGMQTEAIKMESRKLLRHLENQDSFSEWDFLTHVAGKELFSRLGISNSYRSDSRLTCENIVKAEFRKKVLFERR